MQLPYTGARHSAVTGRPDWQWHDHVAEGWYRAREGDRETRGPRWCQRSSMGCYSTYPALPWELMGESVCVCVSQVVAGPLPQVLCWDIYCTMTEMPLNETGWTGQGKGAVKHVTHWKIDLSAFPRHFVSVGYKSLCKRKVFTFFYCICQQWKTIWCFISIDKLMMVLLVAPQVLNISMLFIYIYI